MRKIISVPALLLALVYSAYAGEMQNGAPSPSPSTTVMQEPTYGGAASDEPSNGVVDISTQIALDALAILPSLL